MPIMVDIKISLCDKLWNSDKEHIQIIFVKVNLTTELNHMKKNNLVKIIFLRPKHYIFSWHLC